MIKSIKVCKIIFFVFIKKNLYCIDETLQILLNFYPKILFVTFK